MRFLQRRRNLSVQLAELETQLNEQILECIHNNLNLSGKVLEIDFALELNENISTSSIGYEARANIVKEGRKAQELLREERNEGEKKRSELVELKKKITALIAQKKLVSNTDDENNFKASTI